MAQHCALAQRLWKVCHPYAYATAPQHTFCERVERFLPELFVFVAIAGVPAQKAWAALNVRPMVVARKTSDGTRSPEGIQSRMGLASLFGTWMAKYLNPLTNV